MSEYSIKVTSIPQNNVEDREKNVEFKNNLIPITYGAMKRRNFRIDDEIHDKILDSGQNAIKVFRYVKSHTNIQNNKVSIKASDVIDYFRKLNISCDKSVVSKGIKILTDLKFLIKCNKLEVYKSDPSNVFLVNPNYYVNSSVDTIFRRIQSDERVKYDYERIKREDELRNKREQEVAKLRGKPIVKIK